MMLTFYPITIMPALADDGLPRVAAGAQPGPQNFRLDDARLFRKGLRHNSLQTKTGSRLLLTGHSRNFNISGVDLCQDLFASLVAPN